MHRDGVERSEAAGPSTVALFGGSFNPPHAAHERIVELLLEQAVADEVWIVPAHEHPFGKPLVSFDARLAMCRLSFERFGDRVRVLALEGELGGVSYTVRTLEELRRRYPDRRFKLVVGSDVLGEQGQWRDFERVLALASFVVVPREGHPTRDERALAVDPVANISSTEVRKRLAEGRALGDLVSPVVARYIAAHKLYRDSEPPAHRDRSQGSESHR